MSNIETRFRCAECGRITGGRLSRGGDGTWHYPLRHKGLDADICPGVFREAVYVDVDVETGDVERAYGGSE